MYTIYVNNTLPPALAVHEIYREGRLGNKNFFVPMRDARGYRIRLKKHLYAPIGALLTNYSFKPVNSFKVNICG